MTGVQLEEGPDRELGLHGEVSLEESDPSWSHIRRTSDAPPGSTDHHASQTLSDITTLERTFWHFSELRLKSCCSIVDMFT
eukprot:3587167-Amphidinium_carterae.2